jgi:hypothetical protein
MTNIAPTYIPNKCLSRWLRRKTVMLMIIVVMIMLHSSSTQLSDKLVIAQIVKNSPLFTHHESSFGLDIEKDESVQNLTLYLFTKLTN